MAAGGVGSSVGGAAGDNGSRGGSNGYGGRTGGLFGGSVSGVGLGGANNGKTGSLAQAIANALGVSVGSISNVQSDRENGGYTANVKGTGTVSGIQASTGGGALSNGNGGSNSTGGLNGGNGGSNPLAGRTTSQLQEAIAQAMKGVNNQLPGPKLNAAQRAMYQNTVNNLQAEINSRNAAQQQAAPNNTAQAAQQAAQQQAEAQRQAQAAEAARQAEAARVAEAARQQRISAENTQRQSLQQQLGQTDSVDATRALVNQINGLSSEADNAASLNKSLLDAANARLGQQTEAAKNSAIGSAQAAQQAVSGTTTTGPNTALYSSKISQAIGTQISQADQKANAAEAARMGGYSDQDESTTAKIGRVAKAALGGLGAAGPVGGLLGGAAAVYSNFVSDRSTASSRALTQGTSANKAGIGDVLAGMAKGGLTGLAAGPVGGIVGLLAGGMTASGAAPTAEDLKGTNPLNNGVTADANSYGPGQTLVNGQRVGQGNQNNYKPGSLGSIFTPGKGSSGNPVNPSPTPGGGNTGGTTTPGTGSDGIDNMNKAGQSAFSSFIDDLRKRQMNNLLYTNAGWNGTSGTSLLGRVSGSQGAVGGLTGQIISQYGGGRSLLGGAWSF